MFFDWLLLLAGLFFFNIEDPSGCLTCCCIFLVNKAYQHFKSTGITNPNPAMVFSLFQILTTMANYDLIRRFENGISLSSYKYAIPEYFNEAALVWFLGNFFFFLGYGVKQKQRYVIGKLISDKSTLISWFYISVLISFSKYLSFIYLPGAIGSFFYLLPLFFLFFITRVAYSIDSFSLKIYAQLLLVIITALGILFGFLRFEFIIGVVLFTLGALSSKKGFLVLKTRFFIPIYGFVFLFMVFFDYFGAVRGNVSDGLDRLSIFTYENAEKQKQKQAEEFNAFQRQANFAQITNVIKLNKEGHNYVEEAFTPLILAFIPRFIWPGKPKIALGVWFALEIGLAIKSGDWYNTSINMTIPGHLFLGFGFIGVIFGSLLFGVFVKYLWHASSMKQINDLLGNFFSIYLLYLAVQGFGADLQIIITMIATFLLFLAISKIFEFTRRTSISR